MSDSENATLTDTGASPVALEPTPDLDIVVFGASGDLASRKVLPAVGAVASRARLHVVGAGRSDLSNERFRQMVGDSTGRPDLAAGADWVRLDYGDAATYPGLRAALRRDVAVRHDDDAACSVQWFRG